MLSWDTEIVLSSHRHIFKLHLESCPRFPTTPIPSWSSIHSCQPHKMNGLNSEEPRPSGHHDLFSGTMDMDVEARLQQAVLESPTRQAFEKDQKPGQSISQTRTLLKVSAQALPNHLTASTLAGRSRISVPPVVFVNDTAGSLLAFYHLGPELSGHVGLIHGGFLAVLLDECMGRACFARLPEKIGVTANLQMDYRKPVKADSFVVVRAVTDRVDGRKAWVQANVESIGDEDGPEVFVEATAMYIQPKWAASMEPVV
jgi:acyl-coenzyme A thioesterase PaaI-like protein